MRHARAWTALQATALFWIGAYAEAAKLRPILDAIRQVETGGHPAPASALGDGGRSLGPYQITRAYWQDARVGFGNYMDVRDRRYAEAVMVAYWRKYCPAALAHRDAATLARIHNGGPRGHRKAATLGYWRKVREAIRGAQ